MLATSTPRPRDINIHQHNIPESISARLSVRPAQVNRYELAADDFVDAAVGRVETCGRPPPLPVAATVTALAAPVAAGTAFRPVPISRMFESVTLKRAFPMLISSLSRSKTM